MEEGSLQGNRGRKFLREGRKEASKVTEEGSFQGNGGRKLPKCQRKEASKGSNDSNVEKIFKTFRLFSSLLENTNMYEWDWEHLLTLI